MIGIDFWFALLFVVVAWIATSSYLSKVPTWVRGEPYSTATLLMGIALLSLGLLMMSLEMGDLREQVRQLELMVSP